MVLPGIPVTLSKCSTSPRGSMRLSRQTCIIRSAATSVASLTPDTPADDAATPDVYDQVQIEPGPGHYGRQQGDVPVPDLLGLRAALCPESSSSSWRAFSIALLAPGARCVVRARPGPAAA